MGGLLFTSNGIVGLISIFSILLILFFSKIRKSKLWTVTVTPLASIIGSGFLVVAPIMYSDFGVWGVPLVLLLNLIAIGIGWGLRVNIAEFDVKQEKIAKSKPWLVFIERSSNWVLGICYVVAIAFYTSILSSFVFEIFHIKGSDMVLGSIKAQVLINTLSTLVLSVIGLWGMFKGLHGLEKLEKVAVNLKMSVIGGLLVTLFVYAVASILGKTETHYVFDFVDLNAEKFQILGGLLLITQGFETVKFLGEDYSVQIRKKAMVTAQILALIIYLIFVTLAGPISREIGHVTETAIIEVISETALGMGLILSLAAIFSQFGASIADTIGGSGLIEEELKGRFTEKQLYLPLVSLSIILLWLAPVLKIITIASRFFALYYFAQMIIASYLSFEKKKWVRFVVFSFLAVITLLIALFAIPAH